MTSISHFVGSEILKVWSIILYVTVLHKYLVQSWAAPDQTFRSDCKPFFKIAQTNSLMKGCNFSGCVTNDYLTRAWNVLLMMTWVQLIWNCSFLIHSKFLAPQQEKWALEKAHHIQEFQQHLSPMQISSSYSLKFWTTTIGCQWWWSSIRILPHSTKLSLTESRGLTFVIKGNSSFD